MAWCFFVAAQYKIIRIEFHRESTNSDWKMEHRTIDFTGNRSKKMKHFSRKL